MGGASIIILPRNPLTYINLREKYWSNPIRTLLFEIQTRLSRMVYNPKIIACDYTGYI